MSVPASFSLVTLNTWKDGGSYRRRLSLTARQLAVLAPSLVVLQEVFAAPDTGVHTGDTLAAALRMQHVYEPVHRGRRDGAGTVKTTSGLSMLSRIPIDAHLRIPLTPDAKGERVAMAARLKWKGWQLVVVDLHLSYGPEAEALRRQQIEETVTAANRSGPFDAIVLAGDFNAEPASPCLEWLRSESGFSVRQAWDAAGGPQPTMTDPPGSTIIGARCVDHIVLLQPPERAVLEFVSVERVLDRPDGETGLLPSDHAGVRAVLSQAV